MASERNSSQTLVSIQNAIQSGDLTHASQEIEDALRDDPSDRGGLINLRGVIHARRDEIAAARKDFAEAVRLSPALTPAWENLARACQLQAAQDTSALSCAIDSWRHVLRLAPQNGEPHASLALLYQKQGSYSESFSELAKLSPTDAANTTSLGIRCLDLCGLHRIVEARTVATSLAQKPDFSDADVASMHGPLDSPESAGVLIVLVESLDARETISLPSLQRLAIAYESVGRIADARKTLERVAAQDSTNTAHLLELARLAELTNDHEAALGYLGHARDLAPDNPRIHFLFGLIAAEMDLPVEARRSLDKALAIAPDNSDYNYAMGSVILKTREPASSVPYFLKAVKAKPSDVHYRYALAIAYFAAGEYDNSKSEMEGLKRDPKAAPGAEYFLGRIAQIEGNSDLAEEHLRKSIQLMPDAAEPHTELARVLLQKAKLEEARTELSRALAIDPRSFQANAQLLVLYKRTHDSRADQQSELLKKLDEERSKRAELMLRTIEVRPQIGGARAETLARQGDDAFVAGNIQDAATRLNEASQLGPLSDADTFTLAMALIKLGDNDRARTLISDLFAKYPDHAIYIYWLGRLDYYQRRYQEAVEKLTRATHLDPTSPRVWDSLGLAYDMQGQNDQALVSLEKAAELNRTQQHPSAWPPHDLGYLLLRMEKPREAESALRESLRYDPGLAEAHYHLGRTLEKENRDADAVHEYLAAISKDKTSPEPCYSLAVLYRRLHRDRDAESMFAEYKNRKQPTAN